MFLPEIEDTVVQDKQLEEIKSWFPKSEEFDEISTTNIYTTTGWVHNFQLDLILSYAIVKGASDVHIEASQPIAFTILGDIYFQNLLPVPDGQTLDTFVIDQYMSSEESSIFVVNLEYDKNYTIKRGKFQGKRCRLNVGKSAGHCMMTLRLISDDIPSMQSLGITDDLYKLFLAPSGVTLVCGSTGSGKSTTLASVVREIQLTKRKKIITAEKPVEYIYPHDGKSLIVQRDIPSDCKSFMNGLTSAMRSAIDFILIGEVRNKEEVEELLRASETGHMALSTIHTNNNKATLDRILSLFPGDESKRICDTLATHLRAIINQVLVKSKDGKSRFAIREVLRVDFSMRHLIREGNFEEIRKLQEESKSTMEHMLLAAYREDKITLEEAREKAPDITYFDYLYKESGL